MSKLMTFKSTEDTLISFDDFTDNTAEYGSYWVEMCKSCVQKYNAGLVNKLDHGAMGTCSVAGCNNEADYYIDFEQSEVQFETCN